MRWLVFIAAVNAIAAVLYYLKIRRHRHNDPEVAIDTPAATGFYPEIEKCHEINVKSITCSCPDFRKEREHFRHDDPRRLCKHLVKSFIDANSLPEDLAFFRKGIERRAEGHSGFPADRRRFEKLLDGKRISLMVPKEVTEEDPRIDVYCEGGLYSYSPEFKKWANETAPPQEKEVIRFLYEKLGEPVPEAMLNRKGTRPRVPVEEREERGSSAHCMSEELKTVELFLKTILPPDGEVALKETKSYIAVTMKDRRKWICRLYLNSRKSKHIEFPDGRRYPLTAVEDITNYREQLADAYGEQNPKKGKARLLFPMSGNNAATLNMTPVESHDNVQLFSQN